MSYFISLTAIFMAVFALKYFTKQKVEILFPIVNLGIIFVLYLFGLCQILFAGGFILLVGILILFGFAVFKIIKNKEKEFVKQFFSPVVILLLVFSVAQFVALFKMEVISHDELTHWGLVVKNMFYYHDFGGGETATTMFKGYPIGSSLFLYFFEMFGVAFQPAHLYMAMNFLNISLLLPVISKVEYNSRKIAFSGILIAVVLAFNVKTFMSIWNDQFLSIAFAYVLISYFCFITDDGLPKSNLISLVLGSFMLVSSKSTGLILVIIAYIIIGLDLLINKRHVFKTNKKKTIFAILLALFSVIFAKVSWSIYLKFIEIGGAWQTNELTISNLFKYIFAPNTFQKQVTKNFIFALFWPFGNTGNAGSTPIPVIIDVGIIISLILLIKKKKQHGRNGLVLSVGIFTTLFAYLIGTLISYIFTFSQGEALGLASFVRYVNTYVLGIIIFLVAYLLSLVRPKTTLKPCGILVVVISVVMLVIGGAACPIISNKMNKTLSKYQAYSVGLANFKATDKVYIIGVDLDVKDYLIMRYMATPIDTSGLKIGGSPHIGDMWSEDMSLEDVKIAMIDGGYNYLYLHTIDSEFVDKYSSIFASTIESYSFYYLVETADSIIFEKC